ncbi:DcaP family trimeric outer membrane transporter [Salinisphaera aquimarina]|uniref:DcaP family trimeric outer membrane transporter n=1 Tax=Salinisphaera aquimarina TaxID=2094031 RepID=A0ABV7EQ94_9GAMM
MSTIPFRSTTVGAAVKSVLGTAVAVPLLVAAMPAVAQQSQQEQMQELQQQIEQLQSKFNQMQSDQVQKDARIEQLQAQQEQMSEGSMVSDTEESSSDGEGFKVGNTTIQLNGYFKLDAIYDFEDDHGTSLGPSDAIGTLNNKGTDRPGDGNIGATVKQTRLKLSTTTSTETFGDIGGYIEMDLYGSPYDGSFGGGPSPRVRRAYLTIGNWLIGRDWSTFSDFNYGTTLNFYGPQGQLFERQAQVRYTFHLPDESTFDVALETPTGDGVTSGPVQDDLPFKQADKQGNEDNPLPDFVVRYQGSQGPVSFQVAGIARYLKADIQGFNGADSNSNDSVLGWGLDAGATLALPTGTTLMGTVAGGEGIGKYIYAPAGGTDTYVDDNGNLEAFQRWGYTATISQALTSELTGNVVWGQAFSESPNNVDYSTDGLHDNSDTLAVNLLYTPVDPLTFGIEYNRSFYEQQDGTDAQAQNVQFSTIYNF